MGTPLAKTYVFQNPTSYPASVTPPCFFISTINRESSSPFAYGATYAETYVWEYNYELSSRGELVGQYEDCAGSINGHLKAIHDFSKEGRVISSEDN